MISPVRITDKDGNSARVADDGTGVIRLAVDAVIGGGGGGVVPVNIVASIPIPLAFANLQAAFVESTAPLGPSATFNGAPHDCINYAGFGVSLYIERGGADTNVDLVVEDSIDGGITWRVLRPAINLPVTASQLTNRASVVMSTIGQFVRATIINRTANVLGVTELAVMLKPVP
jgi:hypothetical protein